MTSKMPKFHLIRISRLLTTTFKKHVLVSCLIGVEKGLGNSYKYLFYLLVITDEI